MQNFDYAEIWEDIYTQINSYEEVDANQLNAFFSRLHLQAFSTGFIMLTADNEFIKSWIEHHYLELIERALLDLYHDEFVVVIEVDESGAQTYGNPAMGVAAAAPANAKPQVSRAPQNPVPEQNVIENNTAQAKGEPRKAKEHLTSTVSNLTFSNYVIGNSNRMAYSMALAVAEKPGTAHLNPLFIYGKSGVGKTHLLRAIQNHINDTSNGFIKTVYVDSTEFINDYANASADHSQEKASFKNFKKNYEDADVLLIDDVQSFQGKTQTLEIIFQLFNSLTSAGKQVVMSADIAPKNIDIDERYTSRFNQGATFDIQAPEIETKRAIVSAFIQEYRESEECDNLYIPEEVQEYIAENSSSNIRELKSAITKIIYQMIYTNQTTISIEEVARTLENHFSGGKTKRLTIADIQHEVETFYRVSHEDLIGKKRNRSIAHPRQVAMYLCRQLLDNNAYQRIGDEFGKKDHTTVMHSVGLVETKLKENKEVREEIDIIIQRIREN